GAEPPRSALARSVTARARARLLKGDDVRAAPSGLAQIEHHLGTGVLAAHAMLRARDAIGLERATLHGRVGRGRRAWPLGWGGRGASGLLLPAKHLRELLGPTLAERAHPEHVVDQALVGVGEDRPRLGSLLEPDLGVRVFRRAVRVQRAGECAPRGLDLVG